MAHFTVRIELHDARRVSEPLHTAMREAGFTPSVSYGGGACRSVTVEYLIDGLAGTSRSVCDWLKAKVDAVHIPNSILVREA
jgi:hypothetical protein